MNCEGRRSTWSSRKAYWGRLRQPPYTTTNHGSQLRSSCWFYGGRKTGEPGEKPSKRGRDQLQQLYTHMSSKFFLRISTRLYPGVHPSRYKAWFTRACEASASARIRKRKFFLFLVLASRFHACEPEVLRLRLLHTCEPGLTPVRPGLTWNSVVKGNVRANSTCRPCYSNPLA